MSAKTVTVWSQGCQGGWEVILSTKWTPSQENSRRLCFCTHEGDATDIVTALKFAHEKGVV